jgi:alkylhydroperoxidase family enzyme
MDIIPGMSHEGRRPKLSAVERFPRARSSASRTAALEFARPDGTPTAVTDAEFEPLRRHFTTPQIVELAWTVAVEHFRAKFNTALGVQSQGLCFLPPGGQAVIFKVGP